MINFLFLIYMVVSTVLLYKAFINFEINKVPTKIELIFLPGAVFIAMIYMFINEMIYMPIMRIIK